jgi:transcriptional regulator
MLVKRMPKPSDLLQGTLDLLILKTLAREPLHGWAIAKRIQVLSDEVLAVGQGSLYPALHRLENQGWVAAEWKNTDLGREAKFYALTKEGKRQLERELESWTRLSSAVGLLLQRA